MYRVHLTQEQQSELRRRAGSRATAPRTRDRLEMVRLAGAGWSIPQIARLLHRDEKQVRHWVKQFLEGGFDALPDAPHRGQESALTPEVLESVRQEVRTSQRTWTAQEIADWVAEQHGVRRSADRVSRMLRRARFSYKRTAPPLRAGNRHLKHKQKPEEVAAKKEELVALQKRGIGSD